MIMSDSENDEALITNSQKLQQIFKALEVLGK